MDSVEVTMKAAYIGNEEQIYSHRYGPQNAKYMVLLLQPLPWEMLRVAWAYHNLGYYLAKKGIACFTFHYRHSGDSEGSSEGFRIPKCLEDVEQVLAQFPNKKLILIGFRFGGNLLHQIRKSPNIIARFAVDPIPNGSEYLREQKQIHRQFLLDNRLVTESHDEKELHGYPITEELFDEIRALSILRLSEVRYFLSSGDNTQAFDNPILFEEETPIWSSWQQLGFNHFSHGALKVLKQAIDEVYP